MARIGRALPSHVLLAHGLTAQQLTLTLEVGVYEIVGQASKNAFAILAVSGSYAITGVEPTLEHPVTLPVDVGNYAYTGTAASLVKATPILVDSGAYTYTGSAAGLSVTLAALTSSYTLTGIDATLWAGYRVSAEEGVYSVTGIDSTLIYSGGAPATTHLLAIMGMGG